MAKEIQFPYVTGRAVTARVFDGTTLGSAISLTEIASTGIYTNAGALSLTTGTEYTILGFDGATLVGQSDALLWDGSDFVSGFGASDRVLLTTAEASIVNILKGLGRVSGVSASQKDPTDAEAGFLTTSDGAIAQTIVKNADGSITISSD